MDKEESLGTSGKDLIIKETKINRKKSNSPEESSYFEEENPNQSKLNEKTPINIFRKTP